MHSRPVPRSLVALTAFTAIVAIGVAAAADPPPLPAEAYTACDSKAEGDACTVTMHDHTIRGTCATMPKETKLHCRPSGPPPGPPPSDK